MSEKDWIIEDVAFTPVEQVARERLWGNIPKHLVGTLFGRAIGRMTDGRVFFTETPITRELWDDKGEEWCAAFVRESARPPEP